ncbi:hypothetical protein ACFV9C_25180 [Kribbella sp. NPDC059898]|uniref:hypothetical protein n=1 Tax=Kribbella sp. NPDC059898 TaxID=3346995 RepID=UPI0036537FD5
MATELILKRWCDGVKEDLEGEFVPRHDPPAPAEERGPYTLGGRPKKIDFCDACDQHQTAAEMRYALEEFGVVFEAGNSKKVSVKNSAAASVAKHAVSGQRYGRPPVGKRTQYCLWCPMDYTDSGLGGHVKKHGFTGLKDALGSTCPRCGTSGHGALTQHVAKEHPEFESVTAAFIWARDNHDPHGVYAHRRGAGANVVEGLLP